MATIFQTIATSPGIAQNFDIVRMVLALAKASGFKNVYEFVQKKQIQPQVMPDEQVQNQVQQGNLTPVDIGGGNGSLQ